MIPFPNKKYQVIYADPPWRFKVWSRKTGLERSADEHYKTMTAESIQNLPVNEISEKDCVLFLWVTMPCLIEGINLIGKWGFKYKTCAFTWVKKNKKSDSWFWGMGYWTRANAEMCILATKGKPKRINAGIHSIIDTPIECHSKKPAITRDKIVGLMGDIPRIELFARQQVEGWDCWGNEQKENKQ